MKPIAKMSVRAVRMQTLASMKSQINLTGNLATTPVTATMVSFIVSSSPRKYSLKYYHMWLYVMSFSKFLLKVISNSWRLLQIFQTFHFRVFFFLNIVTINHARIIGFLKCNCFHFTHAISYKAVNPLSTFFQFDWLS